MLAGDVSLSPWCVKHDERVLVTFELALEGLVGELQDVLLVGEGAEQQQRQDNQALSQHPHGSGLCDHWQVGRKPILSAYIRPSIRSSAVVDVALPRSAVFSGTRRGPRGAVARRLAGAPLARRLARSPPARVGIPGVRKNSAASEKFRFLRHACIYRNAPNYHDLCT